MNLNTIHTNALVAALMSARIESFPNDLSATILNSAQAETIAEEIIKAKPAADGGWTMLSGIGAVSSWKAQIGPNNENELESVIRSSSDMMDVNGNTFTMILRVRSIKDRSPGALQPDGTYQEDTDATLGEQDLAVQVWRDPFTKETTIPFISWITSYGEF